MEEELDILREQLRRERPEQWQQGWPEGLRRRVAHLAAQRRTRGETWQSIGQCLGLCRSTVRTWVLTFEGEATGTELVPVVVNPAPRSRPARVPSHVVLVSPRGYRLEGLDLNVAVDVLERLG